jgi:N6-L-threonylcarbamoyladenine synthase
LFPFVALTVSGGHTCLYQVKGFGQYSLMGQTLDDAAGEAFDKVSKILGLGYPGGVAIERQAVMGRKDAILFPRAYLSPDSLDFSFSGLKTAVHLRVKRDLEEDVGAMEAMIPDLAASFQEAVVDVLCNKAIKAAERAGTQIIVVAGGVACNNRLRHKLQETASDRGIRVYHPRPAYCTDNGAMIAMAGHHRFLKRQWGDMGVDVKSRFPLQ